MNGQMQMRLIGIPNGPGVRWAMSAAMAALGVVFSLSSVSAAEASAPLLVGEGVVDISPPLGTALGGFHYSDPTRPRVATAIHYPPEVRALVLSRSKVSMAIISFDMLNVSFAMVRDVQTRIKSQLGIPATHVRICATHAHSMPSIAFNRHWGANNPEYEETVARAMVKAVQLALKAQATTRRFAGTARAGGANVNRTVRSGARSAAEFTAESTEKDRWVDASFTSCISNVVAERAICCGTTLPRTRRPTVGAVPLVQVGPGSSRSVSARPSVFPRRICKGTSATSARLDVNERRRWSPRRLLMPSHPRVKCRWMF